MNNDWLLPYNTRVKNMRLIGEQEFLDYLAKKCIDYPNIKNILLSSDDDIINEEFKCWSKPMFEAFDKIIDAEEELKKVLHSKMEDIKGDVKKELEPIEDEISRLMKMRDKIVDDSKQRANKVIEDHQKTSEKTLIPLAEKYVAIAEECVKNNSERVILRRKEKAEEIITTFAVNRATRQKRSKTLDWRNWDKEKAGWK